MSGIKLSHRSRVLLACVFGAAALGAAAAAVVYVAADRLDIVEKKRAVAKVVLTVDRNAALTVIAKEGRWYKVSVDGKEGYVFDQAVSEQPVGARGKGVALSKVQGGSIPQLETAAAVKGLGEGARQYASSGGLRTAGLEELIRRSEAVTPAEFDQFTAAGGLGGVAAVPAPAPTVASVR